MKNLKLENFGVQEMDAKEMKQVDGGDLGLSFWRNSCWIIDFCSRQF